MTREILDEKFGPVVLADCDSMNVPTMLQLLEAVHEEMSYDPVFDETAPAVKLAIDRLYRLRAVAASIVEEPVSLAGESTLSVPGTSRRLC
ncbi:MAG: hypothetical protein AAFQ42_02750 [Pseudomonadota bacterium]